MLAVGTWPDGLRHLKRSILLATTALLSVPTAAQAASGPASETSTISAFPKPDQPSAGKPLSIVTGSRLPRADGIGLAPLLVIDRKEFQLSGTVNAETLLNDLPQVYPNLTAFIDNGGDGSAHLDLRGFGSARTLILVDGRRWIPDNTGENVDLDSIPVSLIDSVEISTGGASVAYGSGAVAGTVNFKLRDIDGPIAGVTSAFTEKSDAARFEGYLGYGADFADHRGHVSLFSNYLKRRPLLAVARSFARFQLIDDESTGTLVPTGSSAVPGGAFSEPFGFFAGTNYDDRAIFSIPGVSRPFDFGSPANPLGDFYNFQPDNYLMVPQERWFGRATADYEFSPAARVYATLTYANNKTAQQLAPTPFFAFPLIDLAAVSPHLSASDQAQLQLISSLDELFIGTPPGTLLLDVRYRTVQLGPRRTREDRDAWHGIVGITGDVGPLTYDVSYSYSRTHIDYDSTGDANQFTFEQLIGDGTCNVFGPNLLSDTCISAISLPLHDREQVRQQIGLATISGPLMTSPFATEPMKFVLGAEWRSMRGAYSPDPNRAISTSSTAGPAKGNYDSEELFGEIGVPLIGRADSSIAEVDGGARYSHYSLSNVDSAWSWYAGAKVAPVAGITLRGNYQRSISAPRIADLFSSPVDSGAFIFDPCSLYAEDFSDAVRQSCIAAGVPAPNVFNFDYYPGIPITLGGNPHLRAEKGKSWTAGIVLRPRSIPRLSASVDYFDVRLKNMITSIGAQTTVDACHFFSQDPGSIFCQRIVRDPGTGEILSVDSTLLNFGERKSRGLDAVVDYVVPLHASLFGGGHSSLTWHLLGTWLDKSSFKILAGSDTATFECAGRFGSAACGDPQPHWTWQSRLSWLDGPLTTSLRWRHTGAVRDDDPFVDHVREHIGAYDLFDAAFEARVNDRFTARFGVNNLFDKKPPILGSNASFSGGNTYPNSYDILGRDFFVSADIHF